MLKTVTYEEVFDKNRWWCYSEKSCQLLRHYFNEFGGKATALDILALNQVPEKERLYFVLREEFIGEPLLNEIASRYAERILKKAGVGKECCWNLLRAKRDWLDGKIQSEELDKAYKEVQYVIWDSDDRTALYAALDAASYDARDAAWYTAANMILDDEPGWRIGELVELLQSVEDNLIRRALLGDREAQEDCTAQGIELSCPCCGGRSLMLQKQETYPHMWSAVCGKCYLQTPWKNTRKDALHDWNTRAKPPEEGIQND